MRNAKIYEIKTHDGIYLEAVAYGPDAQTPLVLLHGYSDSRNAFNPLIEALPQTMSIIVFSQRGHGSSSKPLAHDRYTAANMADDVVDVLDAIGHRQAILCGHSMGTWVAMHCAMRHPERIRAMVLIGAFSGFSSNPAVQALSEEVMALKDPVDPAFVRDFQVAASTAGLSPGFLEACIRESLRLPAEVWRGLCAAFLRDDVPTHLGSIRMPVQLIWGDQDAFVPFEDQISLQRALKSAKLSVHHGCGHTPHWEQPEQVACELTTFVDSIAAPTPPHQEPNMLSHFIDSASPFILTDGGIETTLIFDDHQDLPYFAAFHLLRTAEGKEALKQYYRRYLDVGRRFDAPFILESPTWRASADWGDALGYSKVELASANREAIQLMQELRHEPGLNPDRILISGCVGPRGDGYVASALMRPEVAEAFHAEQIRVMAEAGAEFITAITMTNTAEAIGVARAAKNVAKACVISFTVETDGRLPSGEGLGEAIDLVDAATNGWPTYFMINCAHPSHFAGALVQGTRWAARIRGIRANASCRSHEELNEATELDRGDVGELAQLYRELRDVFPGIKVLGGCCGTDHVHVGAIAEACRQS